MVTPKEIGARFRQAREKIGISVEEASNRSRIHPNIITDIEKGVLDRLNKLYMRSFMKKYASFLGFDAKTEIEQFDLLFSENTKQEFTIGGEKEEKKRTYPAPPKLPSVSKDQLMRLLVAVAAIALLVLMFVLVGMLRTKISLMKQKRAQLLPKKTESTEQVSRMVEQTVADPEKTQKMTGNERNANNFASRQRSSSEEGSVRLTLRSRGDAWIRVSHGGDVLFDGTLHDGDSKSWSAEGTINVWTGKAERLDFIVNDHKISKVAKGVVKNIKVSSEGIMVGDDWATRF
ncbi:MAG: DUF4115 domain-containing protein [Candidatus Omnitrophica bacterium]|nr:DUF4115 domain-containing protein [Candidatus Omnitrophota bacterium]